MKRGFTLIEVIVVLVIIALLVGSAVVNFSAGLKAARIREAARSVQMLARHARAVALLKQRPVVFQVEEVNEDGEFCKSRISLSFQKDADGEVGGTMAVGRGGGTDGLTRTLSGKIVEEEDGTAPTTADDEEEPDALMAEPQEFEGVRIVAAAQEEEVKRSRVSVFSNVDVLLKRNADEEAKSQENKADKDGSATEDPIGAPAVEKESTYAAVFEANGRCEPFSISVYRDGTDEGDGLTIRISRFGKVVTEDD